MTLILGDCLAQKKQYILITRFVITVSTMRF